jgi:hypothetical protein
MAPPSSGLRRRGVAPCPRPSIAPRLGDAGVAGMPSNRRWWRRLSSRHQEEEQEAQQGQARVDRVARGRAQLGRQTEALAMNRGETDRSPRSDERARGGGANAPHANGGGCQRSLKSSGEVDDDSHSPGERERLGLGLSRPRERGGAADWARLVRSNPLGLT